MSQWHESLLVIGVIACAALLWDILRVLRRIDASLDDIAKEPRRREFERNLSPELKAARAEMELGGQRSRER
jgi:hypothetical protein